MSMAADFSGAAGRAGLWLGALSVVAGAHLLLALWAMQRPVTGLPDLPDAVFIELEPAPASAPTEPDPQPAAPVLPDLSLPPIPDFPAPDVAQALPDLAMPRLPVFPDPPADAVLASSARPLPRPASQVRQAAPRPEGQTRQARQQTTTPSPATQKTGSGTATSDRAGSPRAAASWQAEVQARVASHMRRARLTGTRGSLRATILVNVAANGRAQGRLVAGTGHARIDQALARQASRMPRLPAPPGGRPANLTLPIDIQVR